MTASVKNKEFDVTAGGHPVIANSQTKLLRVVRIHVNKGL